MSFLHLILHQSAFRCLLWLLLIMGLASPVRSCHVEPGAADPAPLLAAHASH